MGTEYLFECEECHEEFDLGRGSPKNYGAVLALSGELLAMTQRLEKAMQTYYKEELELGRGLRFLAFHSTHRVVLRDCYGEVLARRNS